MTDEEEKVIETLKKLTRWRGLNIEIRDYEIDAIEMLIYLYKDYKEKSENLLKQLRESNEEYVQVCNELRELSFKYQARKDRTKQEIEELKKPKYLLNAKTGEITTINNSEFISKDKIKAKIKELEKQQKEEPDAYLCIKVLRSLLEKE